MSVRIRGIYATALTELLRDEYDVVSASPPIRDRFEEAFEVAAAAAAIETTDDREGIGIVGDEEVSDLVDRLSGIARDTFSWVDPAPVGAVFSGVVTETLGSGAIVDLGSVDDTPVSGFLPYDRVDGYVEVGDGYRVQIDAAKPPWSDDRPTLSLRLRIPGKLVELRRGDGGSMGETARLADILPVDPVAGWTPRWSKSADDASLEAMRAALERANGRAQELMAAIEATDREEPGRIVAPLSGAWLWFGRESRFELDGVRRTVVPTMAGHHRTKTATEAASTAVDFAEAICDTASGGDLGFDFAAVTGQFGPDVGDLVAIRHGKPAGRTITLGRGTVTDYDPAGSITVEREMSAGGTYDALGVERVAGDVATTTFAEGRWWYGTVYRSADGDRRGTYVNVCTPVEIFPTAIRYVDLHVDVVKGPDGVVRRVDDDELEDAVAAGTVSEPLADRAKKVARSIENVL